MNSGHIIMEPTGAVQTMNISPNNAKYRTIIQIIRNSYLDPQYETSWVIESVKTVRNLKLFHQYREKAVELKYNGHDVKEYDMFTCFKEFHLVQDILEHGLHTTPSGFNFLGNSAMGVNLCRHADIQLKAAEKSEQMECYLILNKVMLGRALLIQPSQDNQHMLPANHFDSHISRLRADITLSVEEQAIRSQVFCYEFINGQFSSSPRHVLPYVVVFYKKSLPSPVSYLQQNGPLQRNNFFQTPVVSPLYQQQYYNANMTNGCYSKPRLPSEINFGSQHCLEPPFALPVNEGSHSICNTIKSVGKTATIHHVAHPMSHLTRHCSIHQTTSGMHQSCTSTVPPFFDPQSSFINSTNGYAPFPTRMTLGISSNQQSSQDFKTFSTCCTNGAIHPRNSIPHQLVRRGEVNLDWSAESNQLEENGGMRLPIAISLDDAKSKTGPSLREQIEKESAELCQLCVTTGVPLEDCSAFFHGTIVSNKMDLLLTELKPSRSNNGGVFQEAITSQKSVNNIESHNTVVNAYDQLGIELKLPHGSNYCSKTSAVKQTTPTGSLLTPESRSHQVKRDSVIADIRTKKTPSDVPRKLNLNQTVSELNAVQALDVVDSMPVIDEIIKENLAEHNFTQEAPSANEHYTVKKRLSLVNQSICSIKEAEENDTLPDLPSLNDLITSIRKPDIGKDEKVKSTAITVRLKRKMKSKLWNKWSKKEKQNWNTKIFRKESFRAYPYSKMQRRGVQQTSVFEFCRNGAVKMYFDILSHPTGTKREDKRQKPLQPSKIRLVFGEDLSELDMNSVLNDLEAESVDFEVEQTDEMKLINSLDLKTNDVPNLRHLSSDSSRDINHICTDKRIYDNLALGAELLKTSDFQ